MFIRVFPTFASEFGEMLLLYYILPRRGLSSIPIQIPAHELR